MDYFSDRTRGPVPRRSEALTEAAWGGIVAQLRRRIETGALGYDFPQMCEDGNGPCGTDEHSLGLSARGEIPDLDWPPRTEPLPTNEIAFDLIEFVYRHVGEPEQLDWHPYMRHYHLGFDSAAGKRSWRDDVNRVLQRNGVGYELDSRGRVVRLLPEVMSAVISSAEFDTGDLTLDELLSEATRRFVDRDASARRDAVEKLWDAFERTKTLRDTDKKRGASMILDESSSTNEFRQVIDDEAKALTTAANEKFRIRHSEQGRAELTQEELDYLFGRLFVLLWHLLR